MSVQRKRRAERMANRPQRLALGPVSDHGDQILQAIEMVQAKQLAQASSGGDFSDFPKSQDQQPERSVISTTIPKHRLLL